MLELELLYKKLANYLNYHQNSHQINNITIGSHILTPPLATACIASVAGSINNTNLSTPLTNRLNAFLIEKHTTFSEYLCDLIYEKNIDEKKLYSAIGKDSKFLSKIRCNRDYHPSKKITCALALEMKLSMAETEKLLYLAGYSLNFFQNFDLIIRFSIEEKIYSVHRVQALLEHYQLSF